MGGYIGGGPAGSWCYTVGRGNDGHGRSLGEVIVCRDYDFGVWSGEGVCTE
jgi:hypothetical protein